MSRRRDISTRLATHFMVSPQRTSSVKLSIEERHGAVKELTDEGFSARKIADVVGVSHVTVAGDVKKLTPPPPEPLDTLAALAEQA